MSLDYLGAIPTQALIEELDSRFETLIISWVQHKESNRESLITYHYGGALMNAIALCSVLTDWLKGELQTVSDDDAASFDDA